MTVKDMSWETIATSKQKKRAALIPPEWRLHRRPASSDINVLSVPAECGILTTRELEITGNHDAYALAKLLKDGFYSAEEVTVAFCKRAAIAQQLVNCLTEIFFDNAIARARQLDIERQAGSPLRPLHGVPISLKDSFKVPGVDSTIGLACFADQPDDHYSSLAQQLIDLGAVLYCKTNVPQTMMTADSDNNVFGRTLNPNNLLLTAGGSSGGEGALIALRGSILGVGTDIAGSVRIPAICNGICSHKPSARIIPYPDQRDPVEDGVVGVDAVAGPMATSIRACDFFMKTVLGNQPWRWDPDCHHIGWQDISVQFKSLRIGYVLGDGMYTPNPPTLRTINETVQKLTGAGMAMIPVTLPSVLDVLMTTIELYDIDENKFIQKLINSTGEPFVPSVIKKNLPNTPPMTMERFFKLNADRWKWQAIYNALWKDHCIDAIITPVAPHTALPFDEWLSISYSCIWNLLDCPASVIPTGRVKATDAKRDISEAKHGENDRQAYALYTGPEAYKDAPLAIQVVGQRQEDEKLLQIAKLIERVLKP